MADCVEHELAKFWLVASGDSFVVDARTVVGANGAASYLGKYLAKGFEYWQELAELGFKRRWARSRNWPGEEKMQLDYTKRGLWVSSEFVYGDEVGAHVFERQALKDVGSPIGLRVGSEMAKRGEERMRRKTMQREIDEIRRVWV